MCLTLSSLHFFAKPEAVIFNRVNVIGFSDRSVIVDFLCDLLKLTEDEFEEINLIKRTAMKQGQSNLFIALNLPADLLLFVDDLQENVGALLFTSEQELRLVMKVPQLCKL